MSAAVAYNLNDAGDVVGQAASIDGVTPFRYTDGEGMVDLRRLIPIAARRNGNPYSAIAINASKEILAIYSGPGDFRTELLRPRTFVSSGRIGGVGRSGGAGAARRPHGAGCDRRQRGRRIR
jgi:probable HAF family extracellular repeat protein